MGSVKFFHMIWPSPGGPVNNGEPEIPFHLLLRLIIEIFFFLSRVMRVVYTKNSGLIRER